MWKGDRGLTTLQEIGLTNCVGEKGCQGGRVPGHAKPCLVTGPKKGPRGEGSSPAIRREKKRPSPGFSLITWEGSADLKHGGGPKRGRHHICPCGKRASIERTNSEALEAGVKKGPIACAKRAQEKTRMGRS